MFKPTYLCDKMPNEFFICLPLNYLTRIVLLKYCKASLKIIIFVVIMSHDIIVTQKIDVLNFIFQNCISAYFINVHGSFSQIQSQN